VDKIFERPTYFNKSDGRLTCLCDKSHKPKNPVMEVLEGLDEASKPRGPVMEALEDPDVGNKPRSLVREALEDPE